MNIKHPVYGDVTFNKWLPVLAHRTIKKTKQHEITEFPLYEIMFVENGDPGFIIRNKKTKKIKMAVNDEFQLWDGKKATSYRNTHLALPSAFPNTSPLETIYHIDDNHTNNHVCNLRWFSKSESGIKAQKKSVNEIKKNGGRNGRYMIMKQPDSQDKNNREKSTTIGLFRSVDKCAKFIIEHVVQKVNKPMLKTVASKIRRAIKIPEYKAYGYYFDAYEIEVENEEWKYHPKYTENEFSSHGRVRNRHGHIAQQNQSGSRYKQVSIHGKPKSIHRLIWETFMGEIPENLEVMHDDEAPSNEDNSYRNWLCDLTLGTRSQNMVSFHESKNKIICEENNNGNLGFVENVPETTSINNKTFPNNTLGDLMRNGVPGIQYIQAKGRSSKYVLSRRFSKSGKDISSSGSSKKSDEEKFLEILRIYQEQCKEECQKKDIMELDLDEFMM